MSPLKTSLGALSVGVCGVCVLGALWGSSSASKPEAEIKAPAPAQVSETCAFEVGAMASYAIETTSALDMDMRKVQEALGTPQQGGQKAKLDVQSTPAQRREQAERWRLDTEVLARSKRGEAFVLAARLVPGEGTTQVTDGGRTFLMRVSADCSIADFARERDASKAGAYAQQTLLSSLGYSAREGVVDVIDGLGESKVRFWRDGAQVRGQVQRYTRSFARTGGLLELAPSLSVETSARAVTMASAGWFAESQGDATLTLLVQGAPSARIEHAHKARQIEAKGWRSGASALDTSWVWGRVLDDSRHAVAKKPSWTVRQELVGIKAGVALGQVAEMMRTGSKGLMGYSGYLRDWIRANPGQLGALKAWLLRPLKRETKEEAQLRSVLFMALGKANTPESRALLMAIMTDGQHKRGDTSAAGLALVRANPVPEGYIDALVAGSKELDRHGAMTSLLGMVASEQADQNPAVAATARAEIRKLLSAAESTAATRQALIAVGNAGDPSMVKDLQPFIDGEDAELRALAVRSLRRMPAQAALPIVEQVLDTSADEGMQMTAMKVLQAQLQQTPSAMTPAIRERLIKAVDSTGGQRSSAQLISVDVLGNAAREGDTAAQQALADAFAREMKKANKDVRLLTKLGSHHNNTWTRGR